MSSKTTGRPLEMLCGHLYVLQRVLISLLARVKMQDTLAFSYPLLSQNLGWGGERGWPSHQHPLLRFSDPVSFLRWSYNQIVTLPPLSFKRLVQIPRLHWANGPTDHFLLPILIDAINEVFNLFLYRPSPFPFALQLWTLSFPPTWVVKPDLISRFQLEVVSANVLSSLHSVARNLQLLSDVFPCRPVGDNLVVNGLYWAKDRSRGLVWPVLYVERATREGVCWVTYLV